MAPNALGCAAVEFSFPELLARHLRRASPPLDQIEFAEQVEVSRSTMSRIALGQRPPDIDALDDWADRLGLSGEDREEFIVAGTLAHAPKPVLELFKGVQRENAEFRRQIATLNESYDRLLAELRRPPASR